MESRDCRTCWPNYCGEVVSVIALHLLVHGSRAWMFCVNFHLQHHQAHYGAPAAYDCMDELCIWVHHPNRRNNSQAENTTRQHNQPN